jgi:hypothetical protein
MLRFHLLRSNSQPQICHSRCLSYGISGGGRLTHYPEEMQKKLGGDCVWLYDLIRGIDRSEGLCLLGIFPTKPDMGLQSKRGPL